MKKVMIFLLVAALSLGCLGFVHAAVTAGQDDLIVYPVLELGDRTCLDGMAANFTFTCGPHLRWDTAYTFGGEAVTDFTYVRQPVNPPAEALDARLDVYLTAGFATSTTGGSFSLSGPYAPLFRAVASVTPSGETRSMDLRMSDYLEYYQPDYELSYHDSEKYAMEYATVYNFGFDDHWYDNSGCYRALMDAFRFPVQKEHMATASITKDPEGRIVGIELQCTDGPDLQLCSAADSEGIWFVPVFRDFRGAPLPYESPAGHGIYFIPWKEINTDQTFNGQRQKNVTPDVENMRLCFPLDENIPIDHLVIDAGTNTALMLTHENGFYVLTSCDLGSGTVRSRLEVVPHDPNSEATYATFFRDEGYLLVLAQEQLALTDTMGAELYLTAPDVLDQQYGLHSYSPSTGDLRFDGETLILLDTTEAFRNGAFWAAAWSQDTTVFYGEYDCSLLRGNDDWYYNSITTGEYPIQLTEP